ncbi:MAG: transporter, family, 4-hydroxybenzoate transporter [Sphingomonas bacterium]|nr:transporter, family, 4-hydroxybenzoate transporter [Sphingomonas bacterium]
MPSDRSAARLGGHQLLAFSLCALVALIDGFDTQAIALAAPQIAAEWNVAPVGFGGVFAAGLLGALFGALGFGMAADRFGRKPSLLVAIMLFGCVTLLTPFATSTNDLVLIRFVTGLGLGGALPSVIAVTSEYSPPERRATIVSLMFCGFPLGAVLGGIAAAKLMPQYGWSMLFDIGGVAPLLLLPAIMAFVPESVRFLALRNRHDAARRVAHRMRFAAEEEPANEGAQRSSLLMLFRDGRALGTWLLTATFLLSLMLAYFLVNWLPMIARQAGSGAAGASLGIAALNLGAILGCLVIGRIADRQGAALPIGWGYGLGAVAIALIGVVAHSAPLFLITCFIAGALSIGAQMCVVALGAISYDTAIRGTGVGWLMGTGRIGAIFGPILGAVLIGRGVMPAGLFMVAAAISAAAAIGAFLIAAFVPRVATPGGGATVPPAIDVNPGALAPRPASPRQGTGAV